MTRRRASSAQPAGSALEASSATLAKKLIEESCQRQGITAGQLAIHADRGPSMTSKTIAHLYADLGVTQSHSRPNVSNDNPFSEAQFKTLKYRPDFPERFGSAQHGRAHCAPFFHWYNHEHRHGGIGLLTPHDVHYGLANQRVAARTLVLAAAHAAHPERFTAGVPTPPPPPTAVWINPPDDQTRGLALESDATDHPSRRKRVV